MVEFSISRVESVTDDLLKAFERLIPQLTKSPVPGLDDIQKLLDSSSVLIVARTPGDGQIVGAATLGVFRTPSGLHAHVEDVIVDAAARGQGCGEALVFHLLKTASQMGLDGVSLTCNPRREAANQLYRKMGFQKWETNVYWYELQDKKTSA